VASQAGDFPRSISIRQLPWGYPCLIKLHFIFEFYHRLSPPCKSCPPCDIEGGEQVTRRSGCRILTTRRYDDTAARLFLSVSEMSPRLLAVALRRASASPHHRILRMSRFPLPEPGGIRWRIN
jgi:hypothetical protein